MATSALTARLALESGLTIPQLHLGVYEMAPREAYRAVQTALDVGYRGIDSAQWYDNERECGAAVRDFLADPAKNTAGLTRGDIFYTSKLRDNSADYDAVRASIKKSVRAAGLGPLDMFLLHSPYGGKAARLASWRALEDAVLDGEVRVAGVSNYGRQHLEELFASKPRVRPQVNQLEMHPFNTHADLAAFCRENGVLVEAYAPLTRGLRLGHRAVVEMAERYGATPAQLLVKWSLQHGYVPLPKSVRRERMVENAAVDAFTIDEKDMLELDGLDEGLVTDWDPLDAP